MHKTNAVLLSVRMSILSFSKYIYVFCVEGLYSFYVISVVSSCKINILNGV